MEQNAYEALFIGVNVFIFIIALTAGIMLMTTLFNMINYANNAAIVGMKGSLAEGVGKVDKRIYTGAQLLTFYRKSRPESESDEYIEKYFVKTSEEGEEEALSVFIGGKDTEPVKKAQPIKNLNSFTKDKLME